MELSSIKCALCDGTVEDIHVYKIYKQSAERYICSFCLDTVVAQAAPHVYNRVIDECTVVYHNKSREKNFGTLARIDSLVTSATKLSKTIPESLKKQVALANSTDSPFVKDLAIKSENYLAKIHKEEGASLPKPKEIFAGLNESVVSQVEAKKVLAVAAYNHYKRPLLLNKDIRVEKSNVLITGPTGCGKTFLVSELAKILDVPMVVFDANTLTSAGYSGADVEDMVKALFYRANKNIDKTQRGIIVIDEIDKLAQAKGGDKKSKDASLRGAQEALLKVIEGSSIDIVIGPKSNNNVVQIDTTNILFVCMGAFSDIPGIVQGRMTGANASFLGGARAEIGSNSAYSQITSDDFIEFGLIPELIGRLPIMVTLQELTEDDLIDIMSNTKNSLIAQYSAQLEFDETTLDISKESQKVFAQYAITKKVGARGLRSAFDKVLLDVMFDAPDSEITEVTITPDMVKEKLDVESREMGID